MTGHRLACSTAPLFSAALTAWHSSGRRRCLCRLMCRYCLKTSRYTTVPLSPARAALSTSICRIAPRWGSATTKTASRCPSWLWTTAKTTACNASTGSMGLTLRGSTPLTGVRHRMPMSHRAIIHSGCAYLWRAPKALSVP